jgi:hypothetical protein
MVKWSFGEEGFLERGIFQGVSRLGSSEKSIVYVSKRVVVKVGVVSIVEGSSC